MPSKTAKPPRYKSPREMQSNIVRLILNDKHFLLGFRKALDPEYFTDGELGWIAECALKVFDKAAAHPSPGSVLSLVRKNVPEGLEADQAEARARRLYKKGVPADSAFVKEEVLSFGRHQRLKKVIADSGTYLEAQQFDDLVHEIQEANLVASTAAMPYYDYEARTHERIHGYSDTIKGAIPTGIEALDKHLMGGGLGPGEMGILMGLPGFHKTTFLCNIGMWARSRGLSVLHATFEVSSVKTSYRYDCRISGMTLPQTLARPERTSQRVEKFNRTHPGNLRVIWHPGRTCSMSMLEQQLRWMEAHKGFKPDVLIADYVSKMKPEGQYDSRMSRMGLAEMYGDFRSLSGMLGVPGWTAIQANRAGFQAMKDEDAVLTEENAAESFDPIRDADVVLTINQTRVERQENELRVYCAKNRDGLSQWCEHLRIDPSRYLIAGRLSADEQASLDDHPSNDPPPSKGKRKALPAPPPSKGAR